MKTRSYKAHKSFGKMKYNFILQFGYTADNDGSESIHSNFFLKLIFKNGNECSQYLRDFENQELKYLLAKNKRWYIGSVLGFFIQKDKELLVENKSAQILIAETMVSEIGYFFISTNKELYKQLNIFSINLRRAKLYKKYTEPQSDYTLDTQLDFKVEQPPNLSESTHPTSKVKHDGAYWFFKSNEKIKNNLAMKPRKIFLVERFAAFCAKLMMVNTPVYKPVFKNNFDRLGIMSREIPGFVNFSQYLNNYNEFNDVLTGKIKMDKKLEQEFKAYKNEFQGKMITKGFVSLMVTNKLIQNNDSHTGNFGIEEYGRNEKFVLFDFDQAFFGLTSKYIECGPNAKYVDPIRKKIVPVKDILLRDHEDLNAFPYFTTAYNDPIKCSDFHRELFKGIEDRDDFKREKWKYMLKGILINAEIVNLIAQESLNSDKSRKQYSDYFLFLIDDLRQYLLTQEGFKEFVLTDTNVLNELLKEFEAYNADKDIMALNLHINLSSVKKEFDDLHLLFNNERIADTYVNDFFNRYLSSKNDFDLEQKLKTLNSNDEEIVLLVRTKFSALQAGYQKVDAHLKKLNEEPGDFTTSRNRESIIEKEKKAFQDILNKIPKGERFKALFFEKIKVRNVETYENELNKIIDKKVKAARLVIALEEQYEIALGPCDSDYCEKTIYRILTTNKETFCETTFMQLLLQQPAISSFLQQNSLTDFEILKASLLKTMDEKIFSTKPTVQVSTPVINSVNMPLNIDMNSISDSIKKEFDSYIKIREKNPGDKRLSVFKIAMTNAFKEIEFLGCKDLLKALDNMKLLNFAIEELAVEKNQDYLGFDHDFLEAFKAQLKNLIQGKQIEGAFSNTLSDRMNTIQKNLTSPSPKWSFFEKSRGKKYLFGGSVLNATINSAKYNLEKEISKARIIENAIDFSKAQISEDCVKLLTKLKDELKKSNNLDVRKFILTKIDRDSNFSIVEKLKLSVFTDEKLLLKKLLLALDRPELRDLRAYANSLPKKHPEKLSLIHTLNQCLDLPTLEDIQSVLKASNPKNMTLSFFSTNSSHHIDKAIAKIEKSINLKNSYIK